MRVIAGPWTTPLATSRTGGILSSTNRSDGGCPRGNGRFIAFSHETAGTPMKYDLPPLGCLPAFEAAARKKSFTKAAEELCVTQAAISFQVRNLEKALGVALFERHHRALELTRAGRDLHRAVQSAFSAEIAMCGHVTVGLFSYGRDQTVCAVATL